MSYSELLSQINKIRAELKTVEAAQAKLAKPTIAETSNLENKLRQDRKLLSQRLEELEEERQKTIRTLETRATNAAIKFSERAREFNRIQSEALNILKQILESIDDLNALTSQHLDGASCIPVGLSIASLKQLEANLPAFCKGDKHEYEILLTTRSIALDRNYEVVS